MNDPIERSLAVVDPEIKEIQDLKSGVPIRAGIAIGSDYGKAIAYRMELREAIACGTPRYTCSLCGTPVYLVCMKTRRRFYFRHTLEDGRCPVRTRGEFSEEQINAMRYHGAKESEDHKRMKEIIAESLRIDPRFTDVKVEKVWKGQDRKSWRKPDVQAVFDGIPVAFEIQLSTTFLRVIAERRVFYLKEGALLCWIFKHYDAERARLTQDDIFYNNNHNLFLANEDTLRASRNAGQFILDCRWCEPFIEEDRLTTRWGDRLAAFSEMQIDRTRQRVFLYDYDASRQRLQSAADESALRLDFERFWLPRHQFDPYDTDSWYQLRIRFRERKLTLPLEPDHPKGPGLLLSILYSAREGRPIGWRFTKLIEVAHRVYDAHKQLLRPFVNALRVHQRANQIRSEDHKGYWRKKVEVYKPLLASNHPDYRADQQFDDLVAFLFPELTARGRTGNSL